MEKKLAIITGASSGIGAATALMLARQGYDLCLLARRKQRLDDIKNTIALFSTSQVTCVQCDLANIQSIQSFLDDHSDLIAQASVLINNAGLAKGKDLFHLARWEDWNEMIDVNLKGLLYLSRAVVQHMVNSGSGADTGAGGDIIHLGSVAGRWTYQGGAVYNATKFAVRAISEAMRKDLLGKNIRVTCVEPGMVETEFSEVRLGNKELAKNVYKNMRPLVAQDIAESIAWVLSLPRHINIQELVIYPTDQASPEMVYRRE